MHVLRLTEHLLGFYDGRAPGAAGEPIESWVDDGALSLGICSYALVDGGDAIVYDTHVSLERARLIRDTIERLGARRIRVVLSHWHLDHIAGNEVFADCEIIASRATGDLLAEHRSAIESGTFEGPPAIVPLVAPTTLFDDRMALDTEHHRVELVQFDIHSRDATVIRLPEAGLLLAGDTVEDTVTYVDEPGAARAPPRRARADAEARRTAHPPEPREPRDDRARWLCRVPDRRDRAVRG